MKIPHLVKQLFNVQASRDTAPARPTTLEGVVEQEARRLQEMLSGEGGLTMMPASSVEILRKASPEELERATAAVRERLTGTSNELHE